MSLGRVLGMVGTGFVAALLRGDCWSFVLGCSWLGEVAGVCTGFIGRFDPVPVHNTFIATDGGCILPLDCKEQLKSPAIGKTNEVIHTRL
jgi:hypothetical protein